MRICLGIVIPGVPGMESIGGSENSCPGSFAAELERRREGLLMKGLSRIGGEESSCLN